MKNNPPLMIDHRRVWLLAGPMILSNITVPLVGIVDTAVIGHMGSENGIGAVALGALIFSFLYWGFGFLRMGTSGFVARAYGRQDYTEITQLLQRSLLVALFFSLLVLLASSPLLSLSIYFLQSTPEIEGLTLDYAQIRILSAPATLSLYVITGFFIGLHNTRMALWVQLVLNLLNVILDFLFVMYLDMGVTGVAWASVIAEYVAMIFGVYLIVKKFDFAISKPKWATLIEKSALVSMLSINSHIFLRTMCLVFSFAWFTHVSAQFGPTVLAANAILIHYLSMAAYALDGFANAAEAAAGSAYGASHQTAFVHNVKITSQWAFLCGLSITIVYALFGSQILGLFTDLSHVLEEAKNYLIWMIVAPVISVASYQLDGIFIGTGQTRLMAYAMIASTVCYLILLQFLIPLWGNHGLFMGLMIFMVLRALTLGGIYPRVVKSIDPLHN